MSLSRLLPALAAGAALLSAGCFDFDKQVFVGVINPDKDEAHVLLVYEGMRAYSDKKEDLNSAREMMDVYFVQGKGFYAGHPMLVVPLMAERERPGEKVDPKRKQRDAFLRKHLHIGDRSFFVTKDGALCGTQVVQVRELKQFIQGINSWISEEFVTAAENQLKDATRRRDADVETLQLWQKTAAEKHAWVSVEPGRVNLALVGSDRYVAELKKAALDEIALTSVRNTLRKPAPRRPHDPEPKVKDPAAVLEDMRDLMRGLDHLAAFVAETPWSVTQRKQRLTVSLGLGEGVPVRCFSPYTSIKKGPHEALLEHAKKSKVEMLKDATTESVVADFLKKHQPKK